MSRSEQKLIAGPVEGYKIFNEDMTCRGYQFSLTEPNILDGDKELKACSYGFHFCKYPSGVWAYYEKGRVFKIKAYGVLEAEVSPGADYKLVCERIDIGEEVFPDGDQNTGDQNTGDRNTGDWNTGSQNTGGWNTGDHNCGDRHSGYFGLGDAPLYLFGVKCSMKREDLPHYLMSQLGELLQKDEAIDPTIFLAIPNATAARIKKLHEAFIQARKETK